MHWILLISLLRPIGGEFQELPPTPFKAGDHVMVYDTEAQCQNAAPAVVAAIQVVEGQAVRVKTRCEVAQ